MDAGSFKPAAQVENEVYAFDFASRLASGETISTANWACKCISGGIGDASASSRLFGSPTIQGTQTRQRVTGLKAGHTYRLQAWVTTSSNNTLSSWGSVKSEI